MASKKSSRYNDGEAFRFDFPNELSLSAADLIDGEPKLRFIASSKVSSITEEDIAMCARLSQEKTRPEFSYIAFPSDHPFHGRHYADYRPRYLRGTSIGELFAELDWEMKCLWAGVKSDESKTKFMSSEEYSQLDGLASSESFFTSAPNGRIFMECKSVEVCESQEEISFSDPKMTITATIQSSFSKYLTEIFDSIAHHDEPLFSKVKEVIKLILAMEWFEKKGVKFSMEWINENLNRSQMSPRQVGVKGPNMSQEIVDHVLKQVVEVKGSNMSQEIIDRVWKQLQLKNAIPQQPVLATQPLPSPWSASMMPAICITTSVTVTATEDNFQIKHVSNFRSKIGFPAIVSKETTLTISMDDFDLLYQGLDPNSPVTDDFDENGKTYVYFIIPNVNSWSELFAESIPLPCKGFVTSDGKFAGIGNGGVSARSIPVVNIAKASVIPADVTAVASSSREVQTCKRSDLQFPKVVNQPSTDAACLKHKRPLSDDLQPVNGYEAGDTHRFWRNGKVVAQQHAARYSINKRLTINGRQITPKPQMGSIPLPAELVKKAENPTYYSENNLVRDAPPQQDNQLPQPEQPAAIDKMSPTYSVDSGMYDCDMPQQDPSTGQLADDTFDSRLGLDQPVASTC